MGPSQTRVATTGFRWRVLPWSQPPALPDDGFRLFSYHRSMVGPQRGVLAGTVSNTRASAHGDGL